MPEQLLIFCTLLIACFVCIASFEFGMSLLLLLTKPPQAGLPSKRLVSLRWLSGNLLLVVASSLLWVFFRPGFSRVMPQIRNVVPVLIFAMVLQAFCLLFLRFRRKPLASRMVFVVFSLSSAIVLAVLVFFGVTYLTGTRPLNSWAGTALALSMSCGVIALAFSWMAYYMRSQPVFWIRFVLDLVIVIGCCIGAFTLQVGIAEFKHLVNGWYVLFVAQLIVTMAVTGSVMARRDEWLLIYWLPIVCMVSGICLVMANLPFFIFPTLLSASISSAVNPNTTLYILTTACVLLVWVSALSLWRKSIKAHQTELTNSTDSPA